MYSFLFQVSTEASQFSDYFMYAVLGEFIVFLIFIYICLDNLIHVNKLSVCSYNDYVLMPQLN